MFNLKLFLFKVVLFNILWGVVFLSANEFKEAQKNFYYYLKTDKIAQVQQSVEALNNSDRETLQGKILGKANPIVPFIINYFLPLGIGHLIQGNPEAGRHIFNSVLALFPGIFLIIPPIYSWIMGMVIPFQYYGKVKLKLNNIFPKNTSYRRLENPTYLVSGDLYHSKNWVNFIF